MDSFSTVQLSAVCKVWGVSTAADGMIKKQASEKGGMIVLYDLNGNSCAASVNGDLEGKELEVAAENAAGKAVVACWGTARATMIYLVKDESYVSLAGTISRRFVGTCESNFACIVAPEPLLRWHKLPALPESGWRRVISTISSGGFISATAAFGALISFLITAAFTGAHGGWVGLGVSLVAMLVGLAVGGIGQFFYRRMVAGSTAC
jgi:hypothetical protein